MSDSANRIWVQCKATLLLDTYFDVESSSIGRDAAINRLSEEMNTAAKRLQISTESEKISTARLQLSLRFAAYFATKGKRGFPTKDDALKEMAALYQGSRPKYLFWSRYAHAVSQRDTVPGELYTTLLNIFAGPDRAATVQNLLLYLDKYCIDRGFATDSLSRTKSRETVHGILWVLEHDKDFRWTHRREIQQLNDLISESAMLFRSLPVEEKAQDNKVESTTSPVTSDDEDEKKDPPQRGQTIRDAVVAVLRKEKQALTAKEILKSIEADRLYEFRSNNAYDLVVLEICRSCKDVSIPGHLPENLFEKVSHPTASVPRYRLIERRKGNEGKSEAKEAPAPELTAILSDEDMVPLCSALNRDGIHTVEQLKSIDIWDYMNRHGLYTIALRQDVHRRVANRLKEREPGETGKACKLLVGEDSYSGATVADAFVCFCEDLARRYPLRFRSLLGARCPTDGRVVLFRTQPDGNAVKMMNPVAYMRSELRGEEAVAYARWFRERCGEIPLAISAEEEEPPKPETYVEQEPPSPSLASKQEIAQAESLVQEADIDGMSLDDLTQKLNLTVAAAKRTVAASRHIVSLGEKLFHDEAFVDWDEGADELERILEKLLDRNDGYVSAAQLYDYVHTSMQMFLNDNDLDDPRLVYDLAQHLFEKNGYHGKHYTFRAKAHISRVDTGISTILDIMKHYAEAQGGFFREEDLVRYLQSAGVKTGNLRGQMQVYHQPIFFFYDSGEFAYSGSMQIDEQWFATIASALEKLFEDMGDHVVLRDIQPWWYSLLPALPRGRAWTVLLLQSVLSHYSGRLNGAHTIGALSTQTGDVIHAMLVSGSSEVQTFPDAVVAYLVDEEIQQERFEAEELRQLLVERGMVAGGELTGNMPRALANDGRFAWDADEQHVTVKLH